MHGLYPSARTAQVHDHFPACAAGVAAALVPRIDLPRLVVGGVHEVRLTDETVSYHDWWLLGLARCCCWQGREGWGARGGWNPRNVGALPTVPIIVHWGRAAQC